MHRGDSACNFVAQRAGTINDYSNRENPATRIDFILAGFVLALRRSRAPLQDFDCIFESSKLHHTHQIDTCQKPTGAAHLPMQRSCTAWQTCNQTFAVQNRTTRIDFLLAGLLLAHEVRSRLSKYSRLIKIALDARYIKNLLSTWRKLRLGAF
jgi:hypothetical protein